MAGTSDRALEVARGLAQALQMTAVEVPDEDRAAYHAAASIAANFLVTLEGAAERLAATAGVPRELLVPLARAALENWAANGAEQALTGPVARGDEATIARQREAIEQRAPDLLEAFDALVAASRVLAAVMRTIRTVAELRAHLGSARGSVGLVPTMGALHAGHESLIRAAREENDAVVVSLFVNPAQFNDPRDLEAYPRDERRDGDIAERHGADILFAPAQDEVYRAGVEHEGDRRGPRRGLRGRPPRPGPLRRRLHRRREAVQHGPAGPRLLRPEGRPAGRGPEAHGRGPRLPAGDPMSSPPSATRTASRSPAATPG